MILALLVFLLILTHKHSTLSPPSRGSKQNTPWVTGQPYCLSFLSYALWRVYSHPLKHCSCVSNHQVSVMTTMSKSSCCTTISSSSSLFPLLCACPSAGYWSHCLFREKSSNSCMTVLRRPCGFYHINNPCALAAANCFASDTYALKNALKDSDIIVTDKGLIFWSCHCRFWKFR